MRREQEVNDDHTTSAGERLDTQDASSNQTASYNIGNDKLNLPPSVTTLKQLVQHASGVDSKTVNDPVVTQTKRSHQTNLADRAPSNPAKRVKSSHNEGQSWTPSSTNAIVLQANTQRPVNSTGLSAQPMDWTDKLCKALNIEDDEVFDQLHYDLRRLAKGAMLLTKRIRGAYLGVNLSFWFNMIMPESDKEAGKFFMHRVLDEQEDERSRGSSGRVPRLFPNCFPLVKAQIHFVGRSEKMIVFPEKQNIHYRLLGVFAVCDQEGRVILCMTISISISQRSGIFAIIRVA